MRNTLSRYGLILSAMIWTNIMVWGAIGIFEAVRILG